MNEAGQGHPEQNNTGERILVTYASRTGSTIGVAQAIGESLAGNGAQVDVLPMKEVQDLSAYQAVVAGSAIQSAAWLPEAMAWVREHRSELQRKRFAAFLVCMTLAMKAMKTSGDAASGDAASGDYRQQVSEWLGPVRREVRPVSEGLFAGVLDIKKVPRLSDRLKFRISVMTGVWSEGDHRDWQAIRRWGESLRPLLSRG